MLASLLLGVGGMLAAALVRSPAEAAATADPPPSSLITAPVERLVLQQTVLTRGQVHASTSVAVRPAELTTDGAGSPIVTGVKVSDGQQVDAPTVLLEVSGRPVIVLPGATPAYRDLRPGATGADVAQLHSALEAVGHSRRGPSDAFDSDTQAALNALYSDFGYEPRPSSMDSQAALQAADAQVLAAERALEDARSAQHLTNAEPPVDPASVANTAGAAPAVVARTGAAADPEAAARTVRRAEEDLAAAREQRTQARLADGPMLPSAEVVYVPQFPVRVALIGVSVGEPSEQTEVRLDGGALQVRADLAPHEAAAARVGQAASLVDDATGATVAATVDQLTPKPATDGVAPGTVEAVISGLDALPADWAGRDLRVSIIAATTGAEVLVVPVSAVSAGMDGTTAVTVDGPERRRVEVRTGLAGGGNVEIEPTVPGALEVGDRVIVGVTTGQAS